MMFVIVRASPRCYLQLSAFCFSVNNFSSKALASLQVLWTDLGVVASQYENFLTGEVNQVRNLAIVQGHCFQSHIETYLQLHFGRR